MNKAHYRLVDGIAVIVLDSPPVNALALELRQDILQALDRADADREAAAIVLIGSERVFCAGADIKEMGRPSSIAEPNLPTLIRRIEACSKPVLAAIGGVCMGGGFELALGAHHRIANSAARLALPEVTLGLLPGAGGTQRLARAIGIEKAADFILRAERAPAQKFVGTALIGEIVDGDLLPQAVRCARALANGEIAARLIRDLPVEAAGGRAAIASARERIGARAALTPALGRVVDCLEAAIDLPIEEGLAFERACYLELRQTPAHRALRHAFIAEREIGKIPGIAAETPARTVREVAVVGAGTMGRGIAMSFLDGGYAVTLIDAKRTALDAAMTAILALYEAGIDKGRLTTEALSERMTRLDTTTDHAALRSADLIVEAVFEEMAVKEAVFRELDGVARPGAILATNTSTLDVDRIAGFTTRPQDVVGMHFFSPANIMRLCEVVRGDKTAPGTLVTALEVARKIGKVPVVAGVCDGFIGNRMLEHYVRMAQLMVEEGALPWQVDRALEAWGMAMGPFRVGDLAGNDIGWAVRKRRYVERPHVRYARVADRLCEAGRFGQKTGKGWYLYRDGSRAAEPDPETEALVAAYRKDNGIKPREISDDEIVGRCIYALVNEGARVLEDKIALRAGDIDIVWMTGYGFPRFRGGPMHYAGEVGLADVAAAMESYGRASGDPFWQPAPLLMRHIRDGTAFGG